MLERCYVAIGGEVIGGDHDEHRFCGESGGPFGVGAGRADVQHAAFPGGDVRGDAVGSMQHDRLEIFDGQAACHSGRAGNPQREPQYVVAGGGDRPPCARPGAPMWRSSKVTSAYTVSPLR